jgi:NAD(P)-dependent dehydrogenase (short-subunit alcohol dehydrogenase family)
MSDQVWFITGSSRGLGRAVAEEALAAGRKVAATARNTDSLRDLAEKYGDAVLPLALDVTDAARAARAVQETVDRFGRIDVVVNNAGYANMIPVEDLELDDFRAQVEAGFFGTVHVTKAALPFFRAQNSGHFIQVTSSGGRATAPGLGAYQAAKFAVEGFSGVLNQEVSPLGIKVTLIEPGGMRTDWAGSSTNAGPLRPEYEPTVGALIKRLRSTAGQEPIDPAKVGRLLLEITKMDEPPLHLPLGKYAVDSIRDSMRTLMEDDARWAETGRSVDFD